MPPAPEVPKPVPRRPQWKAGAAVLAAIAVLGYYGYRQSSPVEAPQPAAARSEAASDSAPAKPDDAAQTESPAAPPPETPLADQADPQPAESRRPNAAGLIARPKAADAGTAGTQAPPRQEVCTDAVAALGLCTMTPEERNLAEAVAAVKAAAASPDATEPGKAGPQEAPRGEGCTEAVAALGLCTPATTRRGE
jgi:hypothetical protein